MEFKKISKDDFIKFVNNLKKTAYEVTGVQEKESGKFEFAVLKDAKNLRLDYDVTILPPKRYFMPQTETLLKFKMSPSVEVEGIAEIKPRIIIGVHPYDLKAINQLDRIFADKTRDENYLERRKSTLIISCDPVHASKKSFWGSMDSSIIDEGFDLHLTDIGNLYVVAVGTSMGKELLDKYAKAEDVTKEEINRRDITRAKLPHLCGRKPQATTSEIRSLLKSNPNSYVWHSRAEKCYSCGSCNLVCPTCYCFDVNEEVDLNLTEGKRTRRWDGCLLEDFALVATGENFREERVDRIRHRLYRKGVYLQEKYGFLACVGCGRCSTVCLPNIADPVDIFNELKGDGR